MKQLYVVRANGIELQIRAYSKEHAKHVFKKTMLQMGYMRQGEAMGYTSQRDKYIEVRELVIAHKDGVGYPVYK